VFAVKIGLSSDTQQKSKTNERREVSRVLLHVDGRLLLLLHVDGLLLLNHDLSRVVGTLVGGPDPRKAGHAHAEANTNGKNDAAEDEDGNGDTDCDLDGLGNEAQARIDDIGADSVGAGLLAG